MAAEVPFPVNETLTVPFEASLTTMAVALKVPAASGENSTLNVVLCPALMVAGRLGVVSEKYLVEIETLLTVIEAFPVLVAFTVSVLFDPAVTLPKSKVALANDRELDCCWLEPALTPWHAVRNARPSRTRNAPAAGFKYLVQFDLTAIFCIFGHRAASPCSIARRVGDGCFAINVIRQTGWW